MQAHGRTAWGDASRAYPASGYIVEDEIVFLHGERFGLPDNNSLSRIAGAAAHIDGV